MWSLLWSAIAAAACPEDPLGTTLSQAASMEAAFFIAIDDSAFDGAYAGLKNAMPCIAEPIGTADAVAIHRAMGLGSFVDGDNDASRRSLSAVRVLQPGWTPPVSLIPPGHPLHQQWTATTTDDPRSQPASVPPGGFRIDGVTTNEIPTQRAFVVQALDGSGRVELTRYLLQPDLLPRYDASTSAGPDRQQRRPMRIVALIGAGGLAAGGAVAALGAQAAVSDVKTDAVPQEEVHGTAHRARTLTGAAGGLGGAAVAVGIVTAVRW